MAMSTFDVKDGNGDIREVAGALDAAGAFAQAKVPYHYTGSGTPSSVTAGTAITATVPVSRFSLQVKGTSAAPTAWEVVLEGSLISGGPHTTVLTHKSGVNVDGATVWGASPGPLKFFRWRVVSLTIGSAVSLTIEILGETA